MFDVDALKQMCTDERDGQIKGLKCRRITLLIYEWSIGIVGNVHHESCGFPPCKIFI